MCGPFTNWIFSEKWKWAKGKRRICYWTFEEAARKEEDKKEAARKKKKGSCQKGSYKKKKRKLHQATLMYEAVHPALMALINVLTAQLSNSSLLSFPDHCFGIFHLTFLCTPPFCTHPPTHPAFSLPYLLSCCHTPASACPVSLSLSFGESGLASSLPYLLSCCHSPASEGHRFKTFKIIF